MELVDPLGETEIRAIQPSRHGWVAVGGDALGGAMWTSADGLGWKRLPPEGAFRGSVLTGYRIVGGMTFAWGSLSVGPGEEIPRLWAATGEGWQEVPLGKDVQGRIDGVFMATDGLVVFVTGPSGMPDPWVSRDGLTWRAAEVTGLDGEVFTIVQAGETIVAAGKRPVEPAGKAPTSGASWAWTSTDGLRWKASEVPEEDALVSRVAVAGSRLVAIGSFWPADGGDMTAAAWWSTDHGRTWQQATVPLDAASGLEAVAMVGSGFVAASVRGGEHPLQDPSTLWFSQDGRAWLRAGGGPTGLHLEGVTWTGTRLLAWGRDPSAAIMASPAPDPPFASLPDPEPAACPPPLPVSLEAILAIPEAERRECVSEPVTFRGWVVPMEGRGGVCLPGSPQWLICPADEYLRPVEGPRVHSLRIVIGLDAGMRAPLPARSWVEVTGRFDHPDAASCRLDEPAPWSTPEGVVETCRSYFVAARIRLVDGP
jgi:hypothetical protein